MNGLHTPLSPERYPGGAAVGLSSKCNLRVERSGRAQKPQRIAVGEMIRLPPRGLRKDSHVSIAQAPRDVRSRDLVLSSWSSADRSAPFRRTDWRRSSLYRPASKLSRDDERAPTDRAHTIGGGGGRQLRPKHVRSADPDSRDIRRTALVVRLCPVARLFRQLPLALSRTVNRLRVERCN